MESSSALNALMASGCGLSHQCPGEPAIGRIAVTHDRAGTVGLTQDFSN
jgi:hypothetical protein